MCKCSLRLRWTNTVRQWGIQVGQAGKEAGRQGGRYTAYTCTPHMHTCHTYMHVTHTCMPSCHTYMHAIHVDENKVDIYMRIQISTHAYIHAYNECIQNKLFCNSNNFKNISTSWKHMYIHQVHNPLQSHIHTYRCCVTCRHLMPWNRSNLWKTQQFEL